MSWTRPTLKQLYERARADYSARLLNGGEIRPESVLDVLAITRAGGNHELLSFLAWAFKQIFIDTAESEFLERWAAVWNVSRKTAAAAAGLAIVKGKPGSVLPGDVLVKNSAGATYRMNKFSLQGETGEVRVEALETGTVGNLVAGEKLTLIETVPGFSSEVAVGAGGLTGGVDVESDSSLRRRLLNKIQAPPHGGNAADYVQWACEVPGVERAWCFPLHAGLGTVGVGVAGDDNDSVLSFEQVKRAYDYIFQRCPVTARPGLYVFTPEPLPLNPVIFITPDTAAVRAAVIRELTDVLALEGEPSRVIPRSHLTEAISLAAGEYDHELLHPIGRLSPAYWQLPILGEVTFLEAT